MADRKQTPDVLGEILGSVPAPSPVASPAAPPPVASRPAPAQPLRPVAPPHKKKWEYQVASFQDHRGWRLRYIDGQEIRNWMEAPLLHEYLEQMGEEGWELAAASAGEGLYAHGDRHQLYFKRSR
jgi:hypothetical protein